MPVVRTRIDRLKSLTKVYDVEKMREVLFNLKCETEVEDEETIAIEVQSDRIDMFSTEGIAYAVRLYLGLDVPRIISAKISFKVYVDPPIKRPYIGVAAVKGVKLDEEALKELIEFQERLHSTYGRNRRKVAIGLHDLSKLPQGNIVYKEADIDNVSMVPLFSSRKTSLREVLELTEQGRIYGWIALRDNMHPALIVGDEIIALPPVINSDITRLEPRTRDIFIDVTGTDFNAVMNVLNAIIHALSIYGGEVLGAEIHYPDKVVIIPNTDARKVSVDIDFASKWLGLSKDVIISDGIKALQRMGYIVEEVNNSSIIVKAPMYRCDILHQVDIVEDIAIGLGYDNIGLEFIKPPEIINKPKIISISSIHDILREVLVGLGYTEINTLTLVPSDIIRIVSEDPCPEIINAISKELNALRNSLIPSTVIVLRDSQYATLPVKVFEIGEVVERCLECYNGWRNKLRALFAVMDSEIRFEEIHADLYVILSELELTKVVNIENCKRRVFIDGRCGCIKYGEIVLGVIGEINPEILKPIGLEYPIALVELYVDALVEVLKCIKRIDV